MVENEEINAIFGEFQRNLDQDQEIRDGIRRICKEIDQICREATTVLQIIHHSEVGIMPACLKVRELFERARDSYISLKEVVPPGEYFKYQDHWRYMTQRYCYLISLTIWLEQGILATLETVADVLGISAVEDSEGFHLDIEDYLVGLLNVCSELARLAVNSVTRGDYNRPMQISKFVMELNAGFRLLNLKNDHLRKRFDALKYDVKKIEEVVYDLSIRGLVPKGGAERREGEGRKVKVREGEGREGEGREGEGREGEGCEGERREGEGCEEERREGEDSKSSQNIGLE